jgi:hypothetical protein
MRLIRPATEAEVIAEFLKGEYHQKEYHADRELYELVVLDGNLADVGENKLRRNLLFRRHRVTWNELPGDINWSLVDLEKQDLAHIRVFPRGHWPNMARGTDLAINDLVTSIRRHRFSADTADDVTMIQAVAYRLRRTYDDTSVLLIGIDQHHPLTILDGNHRMIAAALAGNGSISAFRVYCGFSARMNDCLWYQSNPNNFVRHAWRRVKDLQPRLVQSARSRWATMSARLAQGN